MNFAHHSCLICHNKCENNRVLASHLRRSHGRSIQDYVVEFFLGGTRPKCACGCKRDVAWNGAKRCFNVYVTGHNATRDGFTRMRQPAQSREQVDRRNDAIRHAYALNGDVIRQKISRSLIETFASPEARQRLSNASRVYWSTTGSHARASNAQVKAWSGHAGALRRRRVFTPAFSKKISAANMRRNLRRSSREERTFVDWMRTKMNDVIAQHWLCSAESDRMKCYDVFIPSQNLLIEFDGTYWHVLDRDVSEIDWARPSKLLLTNIVNDMRKNRLAREHGHELIRIASDVDYTSCVTLDDVRSLAYHHQLADGTVVRQGTFCFDDDRRPVIRREQLIVINEPQFAGPGRQHTRDVILPFLMKLFREHVMTHGWFYPTASQTIVEALDAVHRSLSSVDVTVDRSIISSRNNAGTKYLKSRFRSYWHVARGPVEAFWNDDKFSKVLLYRLGLNNSKMYDYVLPDGTDVSCHETFDINVKNVRFGLIVQRNAVSFFKPNVAARIYDMYLNGTATGCSRVQRPVVWDPSCGFGARLLGFAAACRDGTYLGTEPASLTFADIMTMVTDVRHARPDIAVDVRCCGSECDLGMHIASDTVDLVFTSPPYFDRERYFDEPGQCWRDYPDIVSWRTCYLLPTFANAFRALKSGCRMVINIDNRHADIVTSTAQEAGFVHVDTLSLQLGRDHFNRKSGYTDCQVEPMLVFIKPVAQ